MKRAKCSSILVVLIIAMLTMVALPTQGLGLTFSTPSGSTAAQSTDAPFNSEPTEPPIRYGKTNIKGVNIRSEMSTKADLVIQITLSGTYIVIAENVNASDGVAWYKVEYSGEEGYIRADLIDEVSTNSDEYQKASTEVVKQEEERAKAQSSASGNSSGASSGSKVWVPRTGSRYHKVASCGNMNNPRSMTIDEAKAKGYTRCPNCW